jgi:hypothetical protein
VSSGQWNSPILLPSTVWKVKIVQTSPNSFFFKDKVDPWIRMQETFFLAGTGQLTPSLPPNGGSQVHHCRRAGLWATGSGLSRFQGLAAVYVWDRKGDGLGEQKVIFITSPFVTWAQVCRN